MDMPPSYEAVTEIHRINDPLNHTNKQNNGSSDSGESLELSKSNESSKSIELSKSNESSKSIELSKSLELSNSYDPSVISWHGNINNDTYQLNRQAGLEREKRAHKAAVAREERIREIRDHEAVIVAANAYYKRVRDKPDHEATIIRMDRAQTNDQNHDEIEIHYNYQKCIIGSCCFLISCLRNYVMKPMLIFSLIVASIVIPMLISMGDTFVKLVNDDLGTHAVSNDTGPTVHLIAGSISLLMFNLFLILDKCQCAGECSDACMSSAPTPGRPNDPDWFCVGGDRFKTIMIRILTIYLGEIMLCLVFQLTGTGYYNLSEYGDILHDFPNVKTFWLGIPVTGIISLIIVLFVALIVLCVMLFKLALKEFGTEEITITSNA
jgi:hypothetical protein